MAEMSLKEKAALGWAAVVLAALALAGMWFTTFGPAWSRAAKAWKAEQDTDARQKTLISQKSMWEDAYREEVLKVPEVANADTRWSEVIAELAKKNGISISSNLADPKTESYDTMTKMDVETTWTGDFAALVRFLYDLENSGAGKFDVKRLSFSTERRTAGRLSGKITLTSIYREPGAAGE